MAAWSPWATLNVNRGANSPALPIQAFLAPDELQALALPDAEAPAPALPMGYGPDGKLLPGWWMGKYGPVHEAPPGARPPSSRRPGERDNIIERIDAYNARVKAGGRVN